MLIFRAAGREEKGWEYLVGVVAGEGTGEELGTWQRAAAVAPPTVVAEIKRAHAGLRGCGGRQ